jgi:hypothetical protein
VRTDEIARAETGILGKERTVEDAIQNQNERMFVFASLPLNLQRVCPESIGLPTISGKIQS